MLQMSCEEHDKIAAKCQFITHTIGRYICCLLHYITCGLSINHAQTHIVIYMFNRYNFGLLFYQDIGRNGYQVHTYWYKRLSFTCSIGIYLQSFLFSNFPRSPSKTFPFIFWFATRYGINVVLYNLLQKDTTIRDSFDLYSGLFLHNRFALQVVCNCRPDGYFPKYSIENCLFTLGKNSNSLYRNLEKFKHKNK